MKMSKYTFKKPNKEDYSYAQVEYNKSFRKELDSGGLLREKLRQAYLDQGIWSEDKELEYQKIIDQIKENESAVDRGGISLLKAKELAIECYRLRLQLESMVADRQHYDTECVESKAENQRFIALMCRCLLKDDKPLWNTVEDYQNDSYDDEAQKAVDEYASHVYGLEPDFRLKNTEMKFLMKYGFADDKGRLINKEGHLISEDGKLIDENNRYVAYDDKGEKYFVNVDGDPVDEDGEEEVEFSPFLDEDGNPILDEAKKKPARRKRTTVPK